MIDRHMVGDGFATKTQYNDVAEVNDIIVMYPQTTSTLISPVGCWVRNTDFGRGRANDII